MTTTSAGNGPSAGDGRDENDGGWGWFTRAQPATEAEAAREGDSRGPTPQAERTGRTVTAAQPQHPQQPQQPQRPQDPGQSPRNPQAAQPQQPGRERQSEPTAPLSPPAAPAARSEDPAAWRPMGDADGDAGVRPLGPVVTGAGGGRAGWAETPEEAVIPVPAPPGSDADGPVGPDGRDAPDGTDAGDPDANSPYPGGPYAPEAESPGAPPGSSSPGTYGGGGPAPAGGQRGVPTPGAWPGGGPETPREHPAPSSPYGRAEPGSRATAGRQAPGEPPTGHRSPPQVPPMPQTPPPVPPQAQQQPQQQTPQQPPPQQKSQAPGGARPPADPPAQTGPAQTGSAQTGPAQTGPQAQTGPRPPAGPQPPSSPQPPSGPLYDEALVGAAAASASEVESRDAMLIRRTLEEVEPKADAATAYFYALLFVQQPELRDLFPASMDSQRDRLFRALLTAVRLSDEVEALSEYLSGLGRGHRKYGTLPEHYPAVGECLLGALAQYAPRSWDQETEDAWVRAYTAISQAMIDAAADDAQRAPAWWNAQVVSHELRTSEIAVITLRPDQPYPFLAGQYASVETPWWPRVWRHYSFASSPRSDGLITFHVKAVPTGWVSSALVHRARPGDVLRLGPPSGSMTVDHATDSGLLCVGGGTGIAPIRALVEDVAEHGRSRPVEVFYGARSDHDLYDLDSMMRLEQKHRWLSVRPVVATPPGSAFTNALPGQLPDAVRQYGPWSEYDGYLSGPPGMIRSGVDALVASGVPAERIRHDSLAELIAGSARASG
jgi:NAD(P)H-flavin reductase/hemoglobin-like flavoprotein